MTGETKKAGGDEPSSGTPTAGTPDSPAGTDNQGLAEGGMQEQASVGSGEVSSEQQTISTGEVSSEQQTLDSGSDTVDVTHVSLESREAPPSLSSGSRRASGEGRDELPEETERPPLPIVDDLIERSRRKGILSNMLNFFKPLSDRLTPECEAVEIAFNKMKETCELIDSLYTDKSIWDLSWEEVKEVMDSIRNSIIDGMKQPNKALLNTVFPLWYLCYKCMREALYDLSDLHEYVAPNIEGVTPVYEITDVSMRQTSIRYVCWQMNVNLAHRMFVYGEKFLNNALRYCAQQRRVVRVDGAST